MTGSTMTPLFKSALPSGGTLPRQGGLHHIYEALT
jgi:hypothetical protein